MVPVPCKRTRVGVAVIHPSPATSGTAGQRIKWCAKVLSHRWSTRPLEVSMSAWNEESLLSWLALEELNRGREWPRVLIQLSSKGMVQRALREAHKASADSFQDTEVAGRCICLTRNSKASFTEEFRQPVRWEPPTPLERISSQKGSVPRGWPTWSLSCGPLTTDHGRVVCVRSDGY